MFENIGGKIKTLATVLCAIGIIVSVITGFSLLMALSNTGLGFIGLIIMIVGSLFSWISSFFIYGFGQLIDNTATMTDNNASQTQTASAPISTPSYFKADAVNEHKWTCKKCGSSWSNSTAFCCSCGEKKPACAPAKENLPTENEWKCPTCGRLNMNYVGTCGCGQVKP